MNARPSLILSPICIWKPNVHGGFLEMKTLEANNSETRGSTENLFYEEMLGSVGNFSAAQNQD